MTSKMSPLAGELGRIAHDAGRLILKHYANVGEVRTKADSSPVTKADEEAEALILERLAGLEPGVPVVAEESVAKGHVPKLGARFFLVDPLDGTKEFLQKNGEFTVNIALIEHGRPVAGVVIAIALLSPLSYILVLTAMVFTPVSLVAPAREVSILFAALMGAHLLKEGDLTRRVIAAIGMVLGIGGLALG